MLPHRGQWRGPGTVIANEGSSVIYVQLTGKIYKCSPEQVRGLTATEKYVTDDLESQVHLLDPKIRKSLENLDQGIEFELRHRMEIP